MVAACALCMLVIGFSETLIFELPHALMLIFALGALLMADSALGAALVALVDYRFVLLAQALTVAAAGVFLLRAGDHVRLP
jgi:hypothetical protein